MSEIRIHIINAIQRNRFPVRPNVIPEYIAEGQLDCNICLEKIEVGEKIRILPCSANVNHKYHSKCIDQWLKSNNTCPTCRAKIF